MGDENMNLSSHNLIEGPMKNNYPSFLFSGVFF